MPTIANQASAGDSWYRHRTSAPGSVPPDSLLDRLGSPNGAAIEAVGWADASAVPLLVVTGGTVVSRTMVGLEAARWIEAKYWTVDDYVRDSETRENLLRFVRAASDDQGVVQEAYRYERLFSFREASLGLFLDKLSECYLSAPRAFEVFNFLSTRLSVSKFRTIVTAQSVEAAVRDPDAARAFYELFTADPALATVVKI